MPLNTVIVIEVKIFIFRFFLSGGAGCRRKSEYQFDMYVERDLQVNRCGCYFIGDAFGLVIDLKWYSKKIM